MIQHLFFAVGLFVKAPHAVELQVASLLLVWLSQSSQPPPGHGPRGMSNGWRCINYPPGNEQQKHLKIWWLEYILVSFWGQKAYFQGLCMAMFVSGRVILKPPTLSPFTADFAQWLMVDNWNILNAVESWVEFGFLVSTYLLSTDECSETKWREHIGVEEFFTNNSLEAIRWYPSLRVSHVSSKNYNNLQ